MISSLPMKHVTIQALTSDLPAVSLILAELGIFNPDTRQAADAVLPEAPGETYQALYQLARSRLQKIRHHVCLAPVIDKRDAYPIEESELATTNQWLGEAWRVCSEYAEACRSLLDERSEIDQLESTLDNFRQLEIDLGLLQAKKRFLDIHIGSVPQAHVKQLRDAVGLDGYLLFVYMENHHSSHVVIIGPGASKSPHLRSVLDTAGYRAFELPVELQTRPELAAQALAELHQVSSAELADCTTENFFRLFTRATRP